MSIYDQIAIKIIKEQESLMGPLAWLQAGKVTGIKIIDRQSGIISIEAKDETLVINNLVGTFESLFGRAGREVCKDAVSALIAELQPNQIPSSLK